MPLDPDARALIDALTDGVPPVEDLDPVEARRASDERRARAAQGIDPEPVARVEERSVATPHGAVPLRVYWPRTAGQGLPLVVYFHGGGWVICDLDSHDGLCRAMTNATDSIVVSVGYRRAPEHPFPAAAEDAYAATVWVAQHAEELGGDPQRISVAGDSAGGNLAAVTALMARDRGGPELAFQLLVYPITDCDFTTTSYQENAEGYYVTRAAMEWYWRHYLQDADGTHPHASPLRADDHSGLPPAHVVTAEYDPLRDEGEAYAAALQEAGVPVTVRRYDGMFHGFFSLGAMLDGAKQANAEAFAALREAGHGP